MSITSGMKDYENSPVFFIIAPDHWYEQFIRRRGTTRFVTSTGAEVLRWSHFMVWCNMPVIPPTGVGREYFEFHFKLLQ